MTEHILENIICMVKPLRHGYADECFCIAQYR
jgi:hypothetical protein